MSVAAKTSASKKSLTQKQSERPTSTHLDPESHKAVNEDQNMDSGHSIGQSRDPSPAPATHPPFEAANHPKPAEHDLSTVPLTTSQVQPQPAGADHNSALYDAITHSKLKVGSSMADSKLREDIKEIRHRREEQRKKDQSFFRDQRQAQLAKQKELEHQQCKAKQLKETKRRRRHSLIKKDINEYRQQEHERRTNADKEYNELMHDRLKKRQEEIKNFLKNRNKELQEKFKQDHDKFVQAESQKQLQKKVMDRGESKFKEHKNEKYVGDWEQTKRDREVQVKVIDLCHSAPFQAVFKIYDIPLYYTFQYFAAIDIDPYLRNTSGRGGGGSLPYRNFLALMNMFQIFGPVIDVTEMKLLYRSLTQNKMIGTRIPMGLTYDLFKESLVRLVAKRKEYFSKFEGAIKNESEPVYLINPVHYIEINDPSIHLYNDIQKERDQYKDLDQLSYQDLDNVFNYLALPTSVDSLQRLFEKLRRKYQKAKPERLKELPKKNEYEKLHKVNEIIKEKRAQMYGPSQTSIARSRSRAAKESYDQRQREKGLRNKSAMSSKKTAKETSFEHSKNSQK